MDINIIEHYNKWHKQYDSPVFDMSLLWKRLEFGGSPQLFSVYKNVKERNKVIDLGCGDGALLYLLKEKKYCDVLGVDFSDYQISVARKRGIEVIKGDLEKDDFLFEKLGKFDCVLCTEVIEHLFDPIKFLKNVKKSMRKDSELFITTPNLALITHRINLLLGRHPTNEKEYGRRCHHIHLMTLGELCNYLNVAGYKLVDILSYNHHHFKNRHLKFLNKLIDLLASKRPSLFSACLVVKAKLKGKF